MKLQKCLQLKRESIEGLYTLLPPTNHVHIRPSHFFFLPDEGDIGAFVAVLMFGDSITNSGSDLVILVNILIIKANCSTTLFKDLDFKYV